MKDAWIVITTGNSGVLYYYGPFWKYTKAKDFAEYECSGFSPRVERLVVVDR